RLLALPLVFAAQIALGQVYVSPQGNDAQKGSEASPVRTLERALELSRTSSPRRIVLRGGTYRLAEPLRLLPADSGSSSHDLVFASAPGEHPVLSGAVRIEHWHLIDPAKHIWSASVPSSVTNSRQLYINGLRATRTRGRVPVALKETPTGYIAADSTMAGWKNPTDLEFVYTGGNSIWSERSEGLGSWTEPRCPIESISGTTITMAQPCWDNSTKRVMLPSGVRTANLVGPMSVGKQPEYVENAFELMGTPGQWYFDRSEHRIDYVPRAGEDMRTADVEMPVLEKLIDAGGSAASPIHNIVFFGLQFSYATWLGPSSSEGFSEIQANYQVTGSDGYSRQGLCSLVPNGACPFGAWTPAPGNLDFRFAHDVKFLNDAFVHLGAAGLSLGDGAQNDLVQGCIFADISGNGLELGGVDTPLAPIAEFTLGNRIENNLFRNVGAEYRGGIPIVVGYARNTVIAHNQIDHIPYAAISMGWGGWPDKIQQAGQANHSAGNVVRDNLIHDLMLVLSDGGGIYTQGLTGKDLADGEKVVGNVIYNQYGSGHEIYSDNGSSMMTISGNVMFNTNHDNWGSRHRNYYDGRDGSDFDPILVEDNYWQQGDRDSSKSNVTEKGNHLIASLAEVPHSILDNAGPDPAYKTVLEHRYAELLPKTAPESPSRVAAAPGNGFAYVTFSPPVANGNLPVLSYTVTASSGAKATVPAEEFLKLAYLRVPSLANGQPVTFTVTATNAAGISAPSMPSTAITPENQAVAPPPAPAAVSAYPGEHGNVSIHFQSPAVERKDEQLSPITAYVVTVEPGGRKVTFTGRNVVTLDGRHVTFKVISGLKPGTYTFRVAAVNEAGAGEATTTEPVAIR
ncbi:MAG: right-handed parallel beta-helix repeat-containing protein, partial [Acidobacteriota bacterium]|nr:right-handed parallel beta-helix repeat-containing protein [Acidobacteriota bacterium]